MKRFLAIISVVSAVLLLLAGGLVALVCTYDVQQRLKGYAIEMLADRLQTRVELDSINVSFLHGGVELYGLRVDDRQGERLAQLDTLSVSFRLWELLDRKVVVTSGSCSSPTLNIYKTRPDSAANYQFVIDTFKKDKNEKDRENRHLKLKLILDVENLHATLANIDMRYESRYAGGLVQHGNIGRASFSVPEQSAEIEGLRFSNRRYTDRNSSFSLELSKAELNYQKREGSLDNVFVYMPGLKCTAKTLGIIAGDKKYDLLLHGANLIIDNGKPHKRHDHSSRGLFDAGHMNITADASISLLFDPAKYRKGDTINIAVNSIKGTENVSGLRADSLSLKVSSDLKAATVSNLYLRDRSTTVTVPHVSLVIPDKKEKRALSFTAKYIHGSTVLKDISKPFAPALHNFTTPLLFATDLSGDKEHLVFRNIAVKTRDNRLGIKAKGSIVGLHSGKEHLKVHFDVSHIHASNDIKVQIVKHFVYRQSLMGLLHSAGDISYRGTVEIGHGYEQFKGLLTTSLGDINASVFLDEKTKYMTCSASSDDFNAGKLFNEPDLTKLAVTANASFDIAGNEASRRLHRKRGNLPAGWMRGVVKEVKYKFITCHDVTFDLKSDGDIATGSVDMNKLFLDTKFDFTFTDTQFGKSLKVRPRLHVNNIIKGIKNLMERHKEHRAEKKERRAEKKEERAKRKAERKAAKAAMSAT